MRKPVVLLVNGNSSQSVTERLAALAREAAPDLDFVPLTPEGGPDYVSTPADVALAAGKVVETIRDAVLRHQPDGCIIACFGEPGLAAARSLFAFPVVGMAEASMLTAMQMGDQFAILTLGEHWPAMLRDLVRSYGVADRCAGIARAEGTPQGLLGDPVHAATAVASAARQQDASTVIIGGAALTGLVARIGPLPGIRLIDCLWASIAQMMALMDYHRMAGDCTARHQMLKL
jgi:Asp/Glu/hydantoin racemase